MYYLKMEICSDETVNKLWEFINNAKTDDWWRDDGNLEWRLRIPSEIFDNTIQIKWILSKFVGPYRCYVQRLEPNTCYNWHTDSNRNASLSMCLNVYDKSFTVFGQPAQGYHIRDMHPLYYNKNTMYLVDGAKPHCGLNFSNETRYLVSISITRPITFAIMFKLLRQQFPDLYEDRFVNLF